VYSSLQQNKGGNVSVRLLERADATPTFKVYDPSGTELASGNATQSAVDTTLSVTADKGDSSITVVSATGISPGVQLLIGGPENAGGETAIVQSVSGLVVSLYAPLINARAIGSTAQSTEITAAIPASACAETLWLRVEFSYLVSGNARDVVSRSIEVTKYSVSSSLSHADLQALDPSYRKRAHAGTPWPHVFELAFERVVALVSNSQSAGSVIGWVDLKQAHALAVLLLIAEQSTGDEAAQRQEALSLRLQSVLKLLLSTRPIDSNQNGSVEKSEQFYTSIPLIRG
jgi:hypothetical protein